MVYLIESFGLVDGFGICFIVFLQGCYMCCQYCYNLDIWVMEFNKLCEWMVDDVLIEVLCYCGFWGNKGGIIVSGGEVFLQIDFLIVFFIKVKE